MKIPIELQNIIYQYKMDMDYILLKEEQKRNEELTIKFSQFYLETQKFSLGDKIINSKNKRIGKVVNILVPSTTPIVIEYDDQKDVLWGISDRDIIDFIHYKPYISTYISDNSISYDLIRRNDLKYYTSITVLVAIMVLFLRNIILFPTLHVFLSNIILIIFFLFILITIYTIKQLNRLRTYRNFEFN